MKPENILFESLSSKKEPVIKLIDFGLSKYFNLEANEFIMNTRIGTPYYMAPEVLEGSYSQACDMWSIGVITYCLLCGYPPFNEDNEQLLFRKITLCDYEFEEADWSSISPEAKHFVSKLMQQNPSKRLTPEEALNHPWLTQNTKQPKIHNKLLHKLQEFHKPSTFQREMLIILATLLSGKEIKEFRETFEGIDIDSSGGISKAEL